MGNLLQLLRLLTSPILPRTQSSFQLFWKKMWYSRYPTPASHYSWHNLQSGSWYPVTALKALHSESMTTTVWFQVEWEKKTWKDSLSDNISHGFWPTNSLSSWDIPMEMYSIPATFSNREERVIARRPAPRVRVQPSRWESHVTRSTRINV